MYYVKMKEKDAVDNGVIPVVHFFQTNTGEVLFKKDVLTLYVAQGNKVDFEYVEITTAAAVKLIEGWQK